MFRLSSVSAITFAVLASWLEAQTARRLVGFDNKRDVVVALDLATGDTTQSAKLQRVGAILIPPGDDRVIVLHHALDRSRATLTILDARSLEVVSQPQIGWNARSPWYSGSGWSLGYAQFTESTCNPFHPRVGQRLHTLSAPALLLSRDGSVMWVVTQGVHDNDSTKAKPAEVHTINVHTGTVTQSAKLQHPLHGKGGFLVGSIFFEVRPGRLAAVFHRALKDTPAELHLVDLERGAELAAISLPGDPRYARASADGDRVYIWDGVAGKSRSWRLSTISVAERAVTDSLFISSLPQSKTQDDDDSWFFEAGSLLDGRTCDTYMSGASHTHDLLLIGESAGSDAQFVVVDGKTSKLKSQFPAPGLSIAVADHGRSAIFWDLYRPQSTAILSLGFAAVDSSGVWQLTSPARITPGRFVVADGREIFIKRGVDTTRDGKIRTPVWLWSGVTNAAGIATEVRDPSDYYSHWRLDSDKGIRRFSATDLGFGASARLVEAMMGSKSRLFKTQETGVAVADSTNRSFRWIGGEGRNGRLVLDAKGRVVAILTDRATLVLNDRLDVERTLPPLKNIAEIGAVP